MIDIRSKYHIALNNVGLVLQNAPQEPAYVLEQAAVFNNRFAQGDRTYDDFAEWWYWAQTDWFQGFKDDVAWEDDGKYFYATNIDCWSEIGAIKLTQAQTLDATFNENIGCGGVFEVAGSTYKYVGGDDGSDSRPHVYRSAQGTGQSWTDISTTTIGTNQNIISQISSRSGILWVSTVGVGATTVILTYDGSTWTDQTAYIDTYFSNQSMSSRCHLTVGNAMYVFRDNPTNNSWGLAKTTVANPSAAGNWSLVFEKTNDDGLPIACAEYNGNIYYLVNRTYSADLRVWNIAASTDTLVKTFRNVSMNNWTVGDKLLVVHNSKLIITIPMKEIWELNGSTLTRIYRRDDFKANSLYTYEATGYLYQGCIVADNKIWWGNLMYDGTNFYNTWKTSDDVYSSVIYPLFTDTEDRLWMNESGNNKKVYWLALNGGVYKGADNKNFLVMNQFDKVSGIDKILYAVTLIFKKFSTGQSIEIEYTTGELTYSTTWTSLGVASASLDGTSVTEKTLYFPVNTTCKKIWYRIKLEGDTTNTPILYDIVTAYLPRPFADKQWRLNIDCGDEIRLLNGSLENRNGRQLKGSLEQAWLTNQIVDFQDVDYAQTQLNGSLSNSATTITVDDTSEFTEVGRLRIEDEIIYYTGKTPTTFTGCTRGQKGTKAVSHADDTAVNNGYKVIIQSFNARIPTINNDKRLEYVAGLSLREVI